MATKSYIYTNAKLRVIVEACIRVSFEMQKGQKQFVARIFNIMDKRIS